MAPDGYHIPGQWPGSESLYNIVDSPAPSPILSLPPELRNTIYEYALRFDNGICKISKKAGIPEPALPFTCKKIRREAIGIFYGVNQIRLVINSQSPSVAILVHKKRIALQTQYGCRIKISDAKQHGPRRWRNPISWLRYNHKAPVDSVHLVELAPARDTPQPHLVDTDSASKEAAVVAGLFRVTFMMRGKQWSRVEETLNLLRCGLVKYSKQWSVD